MKKIQETFIPKNILSRDKEAKEKGIIIIPTQNWFEYKEEQYGGGTIKKLTDLYVKLNGLFKPIVTCTSDGSVDLSFTFKRKGDTFEYIDYDNRKNFKGDIFIKKDQIQVFVNYASAILFTNLKVKNITKEQHFQNYLDFKKNLTDVFEKNYILKDANEKLTLLENLDVPYVG